MPEPPASRAPWALTPEDLAASLGSTPGGLTSSEARARLGRDGPNEVGPPPGASALRLLARQYESPLVLILVFGALVAGVAREWLEAAIILTIVAGSTLLGFFQEHRASRAVAELGRRLALSARALRDGHEARVPFREIVVGDVIQLSPGAVIPADAVLLGAVDLLVSEAALTGESFPVEKRVGAVAADAPAAARSNMVFQGASVRSGSGVALVTATGERTLFGGIADRLKGKEPDTAFAKSIRRFGGLLVRIMTLVVLFVLIVNQLLGRPFLDSLLFAVALAVGLSPELLPAIISVTLSAGARRLAAQGVIVRRLEAIENLGGLTVFCTDKTGTLTEGDVRLVEVTGPTGGPAPEAGRLAAVNATLQAGVDNPLDAAVAAWARDNQIDLAGAVKVAEIPYDFSRKRLSVVAEIPGLDGRRLVTKGAVLTVLPQCSTWRTESGTAPFDSEAQAAVNAYCQARGEEGLRVLALAARTVPLQAAYGVGDESGLCLEGLLVFSDPPKPEAARAVRDLAALGITVKVVSGDNRHTVAHVAQALGMRSQEVVTGPELAALSESALWRVAERTDLFAEVEPQTKERIIRALQRTGHSVGYLGDGVNDAPALYAADVGVSVDQAVDVARESADVVLLKRDLDVLRQGVLGGRRTFANTLKYISITAASNFGNMISMALAAPLLPFLPMAAKQILLNNFLSDMPAVTIASDHVPDDQLARAQHLGVRDMERFMIVFGLVSSAFDLLTFWLMLRVFHATEAVFQTAWFVVSLLTELAVILVLRTRGAAWRDRPSGLLLYSTLAVAALALLVPFIPWVARTFDFSPPSPLLMAGMLAIVAGYAAATEAAKRWFFSPRRGAASVR